MRRALLILSLLSALALAACGGESGSVEAESDGGGSRQAVLAAAQMTTEAGSYRSSFDLAFEGLGDEPVSMRGEGVFGSEPPRGRMTFDMSELGAIAGQDLGKADFIFDGDTVYMRFPALSSRVPEIKEWIKFDLADLSGQLGADLGQVSQINQSDPSAALEYLRAASEDVEEVGEEEVRGQPTTRYRMTVDLRKVAAATPGQRSNVEKVVRLSGIEELPAEVWVDGEGRVRRMTLAYANLKAGQGRETDMKMTMELFDFGVEVDVEPPEPDRVTDIGDFLGRGAEETEHSEPEGG